MTNPMVSFGSDKLDTEKLVAEIQSEVERKYRDGLYADVRVAQAERSHLSALKDDASFADYYLQCLREASQVDINDFDIRERRSFGAPLLVGLKKTIWSLLRFYTYRMWSQQNQVNGLLVTGLEGVDAKSTTQIRALEARVAELEKRLNGASGTESAS